MILQISIQQYSVIVKGGENGQECDNIPPEHCEKLLHLYRKHLETPLTECSIIFPVSFQFDAHNLSI